MKLVVLKNTKKKAEREERERVSERKREGEREREYEGEGEREKERKKEREREKQRTNEKDRENAIGGGWLCLKKQKSTMRERESMYMCIYATYQCGVVWYEEDIDKK